MFKIVVYLEVFKNCYSLLKLGIIILVIVGIVLLDVLRGVDWLIVYLFKICYMCLEWLVCEISKD